MIGRIVFILSFLLISSCAQVGPSDESDDLSRFSRKGEREIDAFVAELRGLWSDDCSRHSLGGYRRSVTEFFALGTGSVQESRYTDPSCLRASELGSAEPLKYEVLGIASDTTSAALIRLRFPKASEGGVASILFRFQISGNEANATASDATVIRQGKETQVSVSGLSFENVQFKRKN